MIKEALLAGTLAVWSPFFKGPKQKKPYLHVYNAYVYSLSDDRKEDKFFRMFRKLAHEGEVALNANEMLPPWERLGGVVFRGKYYHVYRRNA